MTKISNALQKLASTTEAIEKTEASIASIDTADEPLLAGNHMSIELSAQVPLIDQNSLDNRTELKVRNTEICDDGSVLLSLQILVDCPEPQPSTGQQENVGVSSWNEKPKSDNEPPAHRDPDALRDAYHSCSTFVEMTEELGVDVTSETVRQQMIKHGIHKVSSKSPSSEIEDKYNNADNEKFEQPLKDCDTPRDDSNIVRDCPDDPAVKDSSDASNDVNNDDIILEEAIPDGGLPARMTLDELTHVVQSSATLYEAQQQMVVERNQAKQILQDLNLLEFVTGRLSEKDSQDFSREEINRRIRMSTVSSK